jgi:hypothetical protein
VPERVAAEPAQAAVLVRVQVLVLESEQVRVQVLAWVPDSEQV